MPRDPSGRLGRPKVVDGLIGALVWWLDTHPEVPGEQFHKSLRSSGRTEGFKRLIKQVQRVGCGYRHMIKSQRRTLSHIAVTRRHRAAG